MKSMFKEMFGDTCATGRFWLLLGLFSLAAAAWMSFDFGWSISFKHALFLAILTAVSAFLPEAAHAQWEGGRKGVAIALALIAIPTLTIEFYSHAGYTAGLRGQNISEATVQNTKYGARQDDVKESKASLAMWEKQLAELTEANKWAATTTAEALRAQVAVHQKAIDLEAARKGCKSKCEARMREKAALEEKIAITEEKEDLGKRIEAVKRVLTASREKAATTEFKSSSVEHQKKFLSKAVAMVAQGTLEPTELQAEGAEQTVNLAMALAGTGLPALALFIYGLYRRRTEGKPRMKIGGGVPQVTVAGESFLAAYKRQCEAHKVAPLPVGA